MARRVTVGDGLVAKKFNNLVLSLLGEGWKIKWIDPVSGFWKRADVYRSEGYLIKPDGDSIAFGCWSSMTSCIKHGMELSFDDPYTVEGFSLGKR